jgi:hypothetical protein
VQVLQQYRTVSAELQLCRSNYAIISSERVALEVELKAHQEQVQLLLRKVQSPHRCFMLYEIVTISFGVEL